MLKSQARLWGSLISNPSFRFSASLTRASLAPVVSPAKRVLCGVTAPIGDPGLSRQIASTGFPAVAASIAPAASQAEESRRTESGVCRSGS
jgi:hypothetical protein